MTQTLILLIISGPGKLKILKQESYYHDEDVGETCIQRSRFHSPNQEIVQVVGTFKNGSLHGTAKLILDDQTTIIANFKDGYFNGKSKKNENIFKCKKYTCVFFY